MAFKDIAGNERVKRILKLALERDRTPNSLLFSGPAGVGKRQMALTLAKALNCLEIKGDSCDRCASCLAVDEARHPDVMEIETRAGKQALAIDQTRLLKQAAYLRPMSGRKRVFILAGAEEMSADAANSLLKVLEEPPLYCHIVLVTENPFLLLPTIVSRCQTLAFSAIGTEEIGRILADHGYPEDRARVLSLLVGGNLERALELDGDEAQALREGSWRLFESLITADRPSLFLERFGSLAKANQEEFEGTLELFATFARDVLLLAVGGETRYLLNPDLEPGLREAARALPAARAAALLAEIEAVRAGLARNLNKTLLAATFTSNVGELSHA